MSPGPRLSTADRATIIALVTAAAGVAIQIAAGAPYPRVPPAFFILLIPAISIGVARAWWPPALAVAGGLFLIVGLFAAGQTHRLANPASPADAIGLWIQSLAALAAVVAGAIATRRRRHPRRPVARG
jgi:hypothetical protein